MRPNGNIESLEEKAAEVSATLRLLANQKRLLLLCRLALEGEMSVTALGRVVNLSQSALSQHLAKLRADGVVTARERARLQHEANVESQRIYRQKHDAQDRN